MGDASSVSRRRWLKRGLLAALALAGVAFLFRNAILGTPGETHAVARSDLDQSVALLLAERPPEVHDPFTPFDPARRGFAVATVVRMNPIVSQLDRHVFERPFLPVGVEPKRHSRACTQRCEQEVIGRRSEVVAHSCRLVRDEHVSARLDLLRQQAAR